ncbi:hypothetical protein G5V58_17920 [Nocardioides anomalus]|uniref:Uncharacterized protein n=1 Tax=Nocardioides anomalus TaxID=2712223 RepID=A0A6G6WH37_9ACTN|nr:hypothetical protein [Nocardioides anomalus]QIG44405.1 hypothetical protein G5V58_17920 [Nocardioides anomalus]
MPVLMVTLTSTRPAEVLRSSQLLTSAVVLGAAVFVYFHWRVIGRGARGGRTRRHAGWLTAGLFCAAVQGLVVAAVVGQVPTRVNALPVLAELATLTVLAGLIGVARRAAPPETPRSSAPASGCCSPWGRAS